MRLSHRFEQFIFSEGETSVRELAQTFGLPEGRCREEIEGLVPFGVGLRADGTVSVLD
ncbi:hypothetical protein [Kolteria novifilia]